MNTLANNATVMGNLGGDPIVGNTKNGVPYAIFSVANNERYKDKDGEDHETTTWVKVKSYGKLAELIGKLLQKGSRVLLTGKLVDDSYEREDGRVDKSLAIQLGEFRLISKNEKSE